MSGPTPVTRLPAVKVIARRGGTAHETVSDADGVFRFVGLAPGQYRVLAQPGPPFKPLFTEDGVQSVTLDRCLGEASFNFIAQAFQGQVLRSNGAPAANARVTIVDADKPTPEYIVRTTTDARGRWKVDGLGDGRYRVSVSLPSIGGQLEPRTWYPGVSSEAQAQVIVLRERPHQVDLTVP